jgi:uncharacterized membrane protein YgdD (TMEM256/DUF423 family)
MAAISGCMAIAMGAAGAHGMQDAAAASLIEKASYYQLIHSLMLAVLALHSGRCFTLCRWLLLTGIALFCGSLYLKAFTIIAHAPLAPMGGSLLMLAWLAYGFAAWANRAKT